VRVREIMTAPAVTLERSDTVAFAEELMAAEQVRHLPVVDGEVLVGLISQRDVLAASLSSLDDPDEEADRQAKREAEVGRVMRGTLETIGPEADVLEATERLLKERLGCLPVVDERLHVLGVVTRADILRLARDLLLQRRAS
jgi:CBS domain-containing membrane protein